MEISGPSTWQIHSSLFTIRLWEEERSEGASELRMQVRHVLSGETRYFRNWVQLAKYLEQKLHETSQVCQPQENSSKPALDKSTE